MAKPPRLASLGRIDLPVVEASGLVARRRHSSTGVAVIGDRTSEVASATYEAGELRDWQTVDLATVDGWPDVDGPSQFEAIAADGASTLALLREDPAEVLLADTESRRFLARIPLLAPPWSGLAGRWDDPSSRGEGLVLLRGGRLLVAKEKKPRALVEFGPAGTRPQGLSRDDFLDPDEAWVVPDADARFHALAVWKLRDAAKNALGDISALAVGADRSLWLLSDKSGTVARLSMGHPLPRAGGEIRSLDEVYRLPKDVGKPEGIVALDDKRVLVALDTPQARDNGLVLLRPGDGARQKG